jgi:asparagine synthase (glutamine-hydrolysing)
MAGAARLKFGLNECVETFVEPNSSQDKSMALGIAWTSNDPPILFAPAYHPETGVRVFTSGRVAWDEPEWQHAETLHNYVGGLSNRLLLERYLNGGIAALERPNGAAVVVVWEPRSRCLHVLTDCLGYHPLFVYDRDAIPGCIISTLPDAIADDSTVHTTPDYISMVEFLRDWQATPPHTYYQEIEYAGAAQHLCWDLGNRTFQAREYWQPFGGEFLSNLSDATQQFADAIRHAIRIRTLPRLSPSAIYISGGLDSRLLAFAAANPESVLGINLYDVPNREARLAQALCEAAGVKYVGFARDADYYPQWMRMGVSVSGAMWSLEDNHFLGTLELLAESGVQTVFSACVADLLFKGDALERQHHSVFGKDLPFWAYKSRRAEHQLPYSNFQPRHAPPQFRVQIAERFDRWFANTPARLRSDLDRLKVEDRRVRPLCYPSAMSGQTMFRAFPYDSFMSDRSLVDFYSRIPAHWKLNGRLWGKVVAEICGNEIVDANYGWRPGASNLEKLLVFGRGWLLRRLNKTASASNQINQEALATEGSWPNLGWYVRHSPTLKQMWHDTPNSDRLLVTEFWGSDPWQISLEDWAKQPYDFFRLATLLTYWSVRRDRRSF